MYIEIMGLGYIMRVYNSIIEYYDRYYYYI